jgi:hypothetical protein
MQRYFGPAGQITLGIGGQKPYDQLATLVNDVRMLAALGATDIPIYSLETTVRTFGAGGLRAIVDAVDHPMTKPALALATLPTPMSLGVRAFFNVLDATATALTASVTAGRGHLQLPNAYPNGCN